MDLSALTVVDDGAISSSTDPLIITTTQAHDANRATVEWPFESASVDDTSLFQQVIDHYAPLGNLLSRSRGCREVMLTMVCNLHPHAMCLPAKNEARWASETDPSLTRLCYTYHPTLHYSLRAKCLYATEPEFLRQLVLLEPRADMRFVCVPLSLHLSETTEHYCMLLLDVEFRELFIIEPHMLDREHFGLTALIEAIASSVYIFFPWLLNVEKAHVQVIYPDFLLSEVKGPQAWHRPSVPPPAVAPNSAAAAAAAAVATTTTTTSTAEPFSGAFHDESHPVGYCVTATLMWLAAVLKSARSHESLVPQWDGITRALYRMTKAWPRPTPPTAAAVAAGDDSYLATYHSVLVYNLFRVLLEPVPKQAPLSATALIDSAHRVFLFDRNDSQAIEKTLCLLSSRQPESENILNAIMATSLTRLFENTAHFLTYEIIKVVGHKVGGGGDTTKQQQRHRRRRQRHQHE